MPSDYIPNQLQNGLVVDLIQNVPESQQRINPATIYSTGASVSQMSNIDNSRVSEEFLDQQQHNSSSTILLESNYDSSATQTRSENICEKNQLDLDHENLSSTFLNEQDRRMTTAFIHFVSKQTNEMLHNEIPVIVPNKDVTSIEALSDIDIAGNFVSTFSNLDQQQDIHLSSKRSSPSIMLPPLPPLTPISKVETNVKSSHDAEESEKYNQPIPLVINNSSQYLEDTKIVLNEQMPFIVFTPKMNTQETFQSMVAPRKTLPHKKRITKKLKSISPTIEHQMNHLSDKHFLNTEQYEEKQQISQMYEVNKFSVQDTHTVNHQFACELCGLQSATQLDFFNHLKIHYEPPQEIIKSDIKDTINRKTNFLPVKETNLSVNGLDSSQHIFDLTEANINYHFHTSSTEAIDRTCEQHIAEEQIAQDDGIERYQSLQSNTKIERNDKTELYFDQKNEKSSEKDMKSWYEHMEVSQEIILNIDKDLQSTTNSLTMDNHDMDNSTVYLPDNIQNREVQNLNEELEPSRKLTVYNIYTDSAEDDSSEAMNRKVIFQSQNYSKEDALEDDKSDNDLDKAKLQNIKKKNLYQCKSCDKICNSKNSLHYHFLSHTGERPHECDICGKKFFAGSALKVHKRLHSGDKPYECNFCNRPFRQWGDLKYHIQSRHTAEKNHQCEFCGKDFARRYSLVLHRRIHTGEKNYKCEFCGKQFRASSYLQVHRRIHTGEKNYSCEQCGKFFRVKGDLKRHSNIHTRSNEMENSKNTVNTDSTGKLNVLNLSNDSKTSSDAQVTKSENKFGKQRKETEKKSRSK